MKLICISPWAPLDIPALNLTVAHGETFDVDDPEVADSLLEQEINFARADGKPARKRTATTTPAE